VGAVSQGTLLEGSFAPVATPQPPVVPLEADRPSAIVTSQYERALPAQSAALRLVITGRQVPGTRQLSDIPAIVPGPLFDVSEADVQAAERVLGFEGIPNTEISVVKRAGETQPEVLAASKPVYTVVPGTPPLSGFSTTPLVAELLISVEPLNNSRWNATQTAMLNAVERLRGIVRAIPAGYVAYRSDCVTLEALARRSMRMQTAKDASSLATAAGYAGAAVTSLREIDALDPLQARENSCGSLPPLPYYAWDKVPDDNSTPLADTPNFRFAKNGDAVVTLTQSRKPAVSPIPGLIALNTSVEGLPTRSTHRLFAATQQQHLISAYGEVNAYVRPDYVVLRFEVGGRNIFIPPEIPARDSMIVRTHDKIWMYVRVRDYSALHIRQISNLLKVDLDYATSPFAAGYIGTCDRVAAAVLQRAMQNASDNAGIIAGAAHVRIGRLLGIIDNGIDTKAVCGIPFATPMAQAIAGYRDDQEDPALLRFSRQVTAAWEMLSATPAASMASFSPIPAAWLRTSAPSDWNPFSVPGQSTEGVVFDHLPITRAVVIYPGDFATAIIALGYQVAYRFNLYYPFDSAVAVPFGGRDQTDLDAQMDIAMKRIRGYAGRNVFTAPVYLADCSGIARSDLAAATGKALAAIGGRAPFSLVQSGPTSINNQIACNYTPEMYPMALRMDLAGGSTPFAATIVLVYPDLKQ
jgi:hypothetical protein